MKEDWINSMRQQQNMYINTDKFWMVVGKFPPTVRHYNRQEAIDEARRLTAKERGVFYVVESTLKLSIAEVPITMVEV